MSKVLHCEICKTPTRSRRARFCDEHRPLPNPPRGPITEADYLIEDRGHETPCWIWIGRNPASNGYGKIRLPGRQQTVAHIVAYEQFVGPIPRGLQLDHLCRVCRCIRPSHLEPVTNAENTRRGLAPKLSMGKARAIRASDASARDLATLYGVHIETIGMVRRGLTWREE